MTEAIRRKLAEIEQANDVRIIYAVESGSRAWGFASADSDYDVRYIYVRRAEEYLRVDERRDTIEGPLDGVMDFSGWDVRKALGLLRRTNPSLMEWIHSPIVYLKTEEWDLISRTAPDCFDVLSSMHHYMSMTLEHWHRHMQGDKVNIKKYLYVLRPLLCLRYLEQKGAMPPVPFDELTAAVLPDGLKPAVDELLRRKKLAMESELIDHIPDLDRFVCAETERIQSVMHGMEKHRMQDFDHLNELFRAVIKSAWTLESFV